MGGDWSKAVELAVARIGARAGGAFTLQELTREELAAIIRETGSRGATPEATLRRELQQLRDRGGIEFLGSGNYRLTASPVLLPSASPSKCVFVVGAHSIYADQPDRFYRFGSQWLNAAARAVRQWVLYQEPRRAGLRGYYATAKVEQVVRDPADKTMYLALIEPGSYLEFGNDVSFQFEGQAGEQGPLYSDTPLNNRQAIQSIRPISDEDFDRIVKLGLVDADEVPPPREDAGDPPEDRVREDWLGPVERETALVSRTVRDRQFRRRVLKAYGDTCALTGIKLVNGGGRVETQAAHIMGVEHKGPDRVENGIALSGTVHWMFDRGLISLSDGGEILLSHKINDVAGMTKLLHPDRRARLPENALVRPDARFLAWHREWHDFAA